MTDNNKTTYYQTTQATAVPITNNSTYGSSYPPNVYITENPENLSEDETNCYRLSKTVQIFALIDICFGIFYAFFNWYFLIPLMVAIIGYQGAKKYQSCSVLTYSIYQILNNLIRLGLTIWAYVLIRQDETINDYDIVNWQLALTICLVLLGLYIARFSYRLYNAIKKLTPDQLLKVISIDYPIKIMWW
jgi:hypothetical protein